MNLSEPLLEPSVDWGPLRLKQWQPLQRQEGPGMRSSIANFIKCVRGYKCLHARSHTCFSLLQKEKVFLYRSSRWSKLSCSLCLSFITQVTQLSIRFSKKQIPGGLWKTQNVIWQNIDRSEKILNQLEEKILHPQSLWWFLPLTPPWGWHLWFKVEYLAKNWTHCHEICYRCLINLHELSSKKQVKVFTYSFRYLNI